MAKKSTKSTEQVQKRGKAVGIGSRGRRKLTDEQVLEIVFRYQAGGVTYKQLGAEYGVKGCSIGAIFFGRSYAWLTGFNCKQEPEPLPLAA